MWLGEGNLALRFPAVWTCCYFSVCSLSPGWSCFCVAPSSLCAGALPSLSCESCSGPAIQQRHSLPGPRCSPGTRVLLGTWVLSSPGTPQAVKPIIQTSHRGNIWLLLSGWEKSLICRVFSGISASIKWRLNSKSSPAASCQRELAYVAGIQMCKFISCLKARKFKMSATAVFPLSIPRVPPFSLLTASSNLCSGKHSHSAHTDKTISLAV